MFKIKSRTHALNIILTLSLLALLHTSLVAQLEVPTSTRIYKAIKKLNVLGSVLYVAAHPDDENSALISYLTQGQLVRTAYLSLTRGDGGQNLLGNEKGALLGVLRTQELLSARRIDGAQQFFTRAIDFGYSKSANETLQHWDRKKILGDVVNVIRLFKPDVIITRFSESQGGHGHHLVSAILADEAFNAAADPQQYPEQLDKLEIWQAKRIMWNTWSPRSNAVGIDVGTYDPLLGKSYQEFSAASRSMHKSQGFGASPQRGEDLVWLNLTKGEAAKNTIFDGIDLSWNRVENSSKIRELVSKINQSFNPEKPSLLVPDLLDLYKLLDQHKDNFWIKIKKDDVRELIRMCSGLWLESTADQPGVSPGMPVEVESQTINRSPVPITLEKIETTYVQNPQILSQDLQNNKPFSFKETVRIPADTPFSQPFWLEKPNNGQMFSYSDESHIYLAESPPALVTKFTLNLNGQLLDYQIPVRYRWNDPIKGEKFRPFIIRPGLSVAIDKPTYVFAGNKSHDIVVRVKTTRANMMGTLNLKVPEGWEVQPKSIRFSVEQSGDESLNRFQVKPGSGAKSGAAQLLATTNDGKTFSSEIIEIAYDHIPLQTVLQPASAHLVNLDIMILPGTIGYIMGAGDEIPEALTQLGYHVDLITDQDLEQKDLSIYDAIICGIRAYNTRRALVHLQKRLDTYVENGGTWIVQYNTRLGSGSGQIGPYTFSTAGHDRISEENAPIQILEPDDQLFNYPNKITQADFKNWVQERGLYFADSWDDHLHPLLAGHDQGEPSKLGGLLIGRYGKGIFIYSAYAWFRQLPAGVPGAYRLFVNMISANAKK